MCRVPIWVFYICVYSIICILTCDKICVKNIFKESERFFFIVSIYFFYKIKILTTVPLKRIIKMY